MHYLKIVTIVFYVLWCNGGIWGPKQKSATGLLFMDSKKITLNGLEHIKYNRKDESENYFLNS